MNNPPITYCLFECTWNCNLNCIMCPRNLFGTVGKRLNMPLSMFNKVVNQLPNLRLSNFAGLGEPFTHPDIFTMLDILGKRHVEILMTTNGTFLTEKNIKKLPDTKMAIHVSIDSPISKTFKSLRGISLKPILHNLQLLKKIRPDIKLVIQSLFMKNTMEDFMYFIPILKQLDANIAVIYPISFSKQDEELYSPFMEDKFKQLKESFSLACMKEKILMLDRTAYPYSKPCEEPWLGFMVNPKGEVFSCCYVYEGRDYKNTPKTWNEWYKGKKIEVPQYQYLMGNVDTDTLHNIWNYPEYNELRNMVYLSNKIKLPKERYMELRDSLDITRKRYSYCRICLWRHSQAC